MFSFVVDFKDFSKKSFTCLLLVMNERLSEYEILLNKIKKFRQDNNIPSSVPDPLEYKIALSTSDESHDLSKKSNGFQSEDIYNHEILNNIKGKEGGYEIKGKNDRHSVKFNSNIPMYDLFSSDYSDCDSDMIFKCKKTNKPVLPSVNINAFDESSDDDRFLIPVNNRYFDTKGGLNDTKLSVDLKPMFVYNKYLKDFNTSSDDFSGIDDISADEGGKNVNGNSVNCNVHQNKLSLDTPSRNLKNKNDTSFSTEVRQDLTESDGIFVPNNKGTIAFTGPVSDDSDFEGHPYVISRRKSEENDMNPPHKHLNKKPGPKRRLTSQCIYIGEMMDSDSKSELESYGRSGKDAESRLSKQRQKYGYGNERDTTKKEARKSFHSILESEDDYNDADDYLNRDTEYGKDNAKMDDLFIIRDASDESHELYEGSKMKERSSLDVNSSVLNDLSSETQTYSNQLSSTVAKDLESACHSPAVVEDNKTDIKQYLEGEGVQNFSSEGENIHVSPLCEGSLNRKNDHIFTPKNDGQSPTTPIQRSSILEKVGTHDKLNVGSPMLHGSKMIDMRETSEDRQYSNSPSALLTKGTGSLDAPECRPDNLSSKEHDDSIRSDNAGNVPSRDENEGVMLNKCLFDPENVQDCLNNKDGEFVIESNGGCLGVEDNSGEPQRDLMKDCAATSTKYNSIDNVDLSHINSFSTGKLDGTSSMDDIKGEIDHISPLRYDMPSSLGLNIPPEEAYVSSGFSRDNDTNIVSPSNFAYDTACNDSSVSDNIYPSPTHSKIGQASYLVSHSMGSVSKDGEHVGNRGPSDNGESEERGRLYKEASAAGTHLGRESDNVGTFNHKEGEDESPNTVEGKSPVRNNDSIESESNRRDPLNHELGRECIETEPVLNATLSNRDSSGGVGPSDGDFTGRSQQKLDTMSDSDNNNFSSVESSKRNPHSEFGGQSGSGREWTPNSDERSVKVNESSSCSDIVIDDCPHDALDGSAVNEY